MTYTQSPHAVLMIRPSAFGYNEETASSNAFQTMPDQDDSIEIQSKALSEFDQMVDTLKAHDVEVLVIEDTKEPITPDAIFPNNWISLQPDGQVIIYPMEAPSRRAEKRMDVVEYLKSKYQISKISDLSNNENRFLEGTGSIIFDHPKRKAYASYSSRTAPELLEEVCNILNYEAVGFNAVDRHGKDIYHTNVMMCVGSGYALICLDAIQNEDDLEKVINSLNESDKKIISISYDQMEHFAGNMLEVQATSGERFLVLSESAFQSLVNGQISAITEFVDLIPIGIPTIELYGGGSVRCMMAGIHLPNKE